MERQIEINRDLAGAGEEWAHKNREVLREHGVTMLNLIGSPGSGKTALLEKSAGMLSGKMRFAVLEGDIETDRDAERLRRAGVQALQLSTGGACHLSAQRLHTGLQELDLGSLDTLFVENVGNLVCPVEFDVGEQAKVAVLSTTEGEDKPAKYPALFREASCTVITKTDLLPHLCFDMEACLHDLQAVNARKPIFRVSSISGDGMQDWIQWLLAQKAGG